MTRLRNEPSNVPRERVYEAVASTLESCGDFGANAVEAALDAVIVVARDVTPWLTDDDMRAMLERRLAGMPWPERDPEQPR